jgi:hypothetical protein
LCTCPLTDAFAARFVYRCIFVAILILKFVIRKFLSAFVVTFLLQGTVLNLHKKFCGTNVRKDTAAYET